MLRTALTPKWLGMLVVALLIVVAFIQLGRWQMGVARDEASRVAIQQAASRPAAPLDAVLTPHQYFPNRESGRRVTVTGEYRADGQVLVTDRFLDGRRGIWVITPFAIDGGDGVLPVLRGFVTAAADAGAPPPGRFTLTGGLAPGESPVSGASPPQGTLASVDLSVLVNEWPGELYNAFLFLERQQPSPDAAHTLTLVPTPLPSTDLNWRNLAYALQWWVFAVFALWMWWRMVKQAHEEQVALAAASRDGGQPIADGHDPPGPAMSPGVPVPAGATTAEEAVAPTGENGSRDDDS